MTNFVRLILALIAVCGAASGVHAVGQVYIPTQAKPPQLAAAKTAYVANDFGFEFADSDRAYDEVVAGLQRMNRFSLVSDPGAADVILDFKFATTFPAGLPSQSSPYCMMTIVDGKTHAVLWSVSGQGVPRAIHASHIRQNEADVIDRLLDYLKIITGPK